MSGTSHGQCAVPYHKYHKPKKKKVQVLDEIADLSDIATAAAVLDLAVHHAASGDTDTNSEVSTSQFKSDVIASLMAVAKTKGNVDPRHMLRAEIGAGGKTKRKVNVLLDSGAMVSVVKRSVVRELRIPYRPTRQQIVAANGARLVVHGRIDALRMCIDGYNTVFHPVVAEFDLANVDVLLGRDWLECEDPRVRWNPHTVYPTKSSRTRRQRNSVDAKPDVRAQGIAVMMVMTQLSHEDARAVTPDLERLSASDAEKTEIAFKDMLSRSHPRMRPMLVQMKRVFVEAPPTYPVHHENKTRIVYKLRLYDPSAPPPVMPQIPLSQDQLHALQGIAREYLARGILELSDSPGRLSNKLVRKKDGSYRWVVDFRPVNDLTMPDGYVIPDQDAHLQWLASRTWYSSMDLPAAYHFIELAEDSRKYTATFIAGIGVVQWTRLVMGAKNSGQAMQQVMEQVLAPCITADTAKNFLDDVSAASHTLDEHVDDARQVLQRMRDHGLTVRPSKCVFGVQELDFLGHHVSHGRIALQTEKIEAVRAWADPTSLKQLRSVRGALSYMRRHVPDFAMRCRPLDAVLASGKFRWGDDEARAFEDLKRAVTSAPVLRAFRVGARTRIETDASKDAFGAVIYQIAEDDGDWHPVAFWSRATRGAETRWTTMDLELGAVIGVLTRYRAWLLGQPLEILTDHKALVALTTKKLTDKQARWVEYLADFDLRMGHVAGAVNPVADALSRLPRAPDRPHGMLTTDKDGSVAIAAACAIQIIPCAVIMTSSAPTSPRARACMPILDNGEGPRSGSAAVPRAVPPVEADAPGHHAAHPEGRGVGATSVDVEHAAQSPAGAAAPSAQVVEDALALENVPALALLTAEDVKKTYSGDRFLQDVLCYLRNEAPSGRKLPHDVEQRAAGYSITQDGVLMFGKRTVLGRGADHKTIMTSVLAQYHDAAYAGHPGVSKTFAMLVPNWKWFNMWNDVTNYVKACDTCLRRKRRHDSGASWLTTIKRPDDAFDSWSMDFAGPLPRSRVGGVSYDQFFVLVDRLTKFIVAVPTDSSWTAEQVADTFIAEICMRYGFPRHVISDRGPTLRAAFTQQLMRRLDIRHAMSAPYNPASNGQAEAGVKAVKTLLRVIVDDAGTDWAKKLQLAVFELNTRPSRSTGISPFKAVFGREARKPDLVRDAGAPQGEAEPEPRGIAERIQGIRAIRALVDDNLERAQLAQRKQADARRSDVSFSVGDSVYLSTSRAIPEHLRAHRGALAPTFSGPYRISREVVKNKAYELDFPPEMSKVHNVHDVTKLRKAPPDAFDRPVVQQPDLVLPYDEQKIIHAVAMDGTEMNLLYQVELGNGDMVWLAEAQVEQGLLRAFKTKEIASTSNQDSVRRGARVRRPANTAFLNERIRFDD